MDDAQAQGPMDEPTPKPQEPKDKHHEKFLGRLIKVVKPFGGWMGERRMVFSRSDVLIAAIVGYETIGGIETAKLIIFGPPPGIPVVAWGVPVANFMFVS